MTPLILSADDFALHAGIDDAVLDLAARGRLTATSCLTLSPRWRVAAASLTPTVRASIDIGLHLDFSEFGATSSWARLVAASYAARLDRAAIRTRISAQLDAFEDALGSPPDYIDGHRHVHQLPQIRDELLRELLRRYASSRPWIRISRPPAASGLKGRVIRLLGARALARAATEAGFSSSKRLLGVYGFNLSQPAYRRQLEDWLGAAQPRDALMVHVARGAAREDPIGPARLIEYEVLGSNGFGESLSRRKIRLIRGTDP